MNTIPPKNSPSQGRVLILAGGTGGHILPALSLARYLISQGADVHWLGTQQGLEHKLIPPTGIPIHYIKAKGLRRTGFLSLFAAPFRMLRATYQAGRIIQILQPTRVVGFGGFVSGPGGLAAWLLKKPLIIHEQNAIAGLTNLCLARLSRQVFQAFPSTFAERFRAITVGNPVRQEIIQLPHPAERLSNRQGPIKLLILGGSQGAAQLNQILPAALALLPIERRPQVWHSTGKSSSVDLRTYAQLGISARIVEFIDDMAEAYNWADFVVCRAGALTIAELTAAGLGSILIPYPYAVDDHQTCNAQLLVQAGAAILVSQQNLDPTKLVTLLIPFINDRPQLMTMAIAARQLAMPQATEKLAQACLMTTD